jgi:hypothetical protein
VGKFLTGMIAAGVLLAVSSGIALAADYPPCKSRSDDKCMQVPAGMMKSEKMMKDGMKEEGGGKMMKESMSGDMSIPHGCSPVTTPCE